MDLQLTLDLCLLAGRQQAGGSDVEQPDPGGADVKVVIEELGLYDHVAPEREETPPLAEQLKDRHPPP